MQNRMHNLISLDNLLTYTQKKILLLKTSLLSWLVFLPSGVVFGDQFGPQLLLHNVRKKGKSNASLLPSLPRSNAASIYGNNNFEKQVFWSFEDQHWIRFKNTWKRWEARTAEDVSFYFILINAFIGEAWFTRLHSGH